jgi:hypothetical protein
VLPLKLIAYHLHPSRGRTTVTEFDVPPAFRGTVVHKQRSARIARTPPAAGRNPKLVAVIDGILVVS